jgi:hypothetical protein
MSDWIPRQDAEALQVMVAFKTGIAERPWVYAISPPEVETIVKVVDEFAEARLVAVAAATRTKVTIDRMRARRINAEGVCRHFAATIKRNLGISNADKEAIGVRPINNTRTRRECPQTAPTLIIEAATPLGMTLHYRDSTNPTLRAKPVYATMVQLFMTIGDHNAPDPREAQFVGNYTSNPMIVTFDPGYRGKQATFFARWGGRRNQVGQWSLPISMTVAA